MMLKGFGLESTLAAAPAYDGLTMAVVLPVPLAPPTAPSFTFFEGGVSLVLGWAGA